MRLVELILLAFNWLLFIVFLYPESRFLNLILRVTPIAILLLIAATFIEGLRWQMQPAYILTIVLFVSCQLKRHVGVEFFKIKFLKSFLFVLVVLLLLVSTVLPNLVPVFRFPKPSGSYGIGTLAYHWIDSSRQEVFSKPINRHRELIVQIWYPAEKETRSTKALYLPDANNVAKAMAKLQGKFPAFFLTHLKYIGTHIRESAPVAVDQPDYPVLIFLEGLTGYRQMNTFQVEELVSNGYIVVGIDQPGVASSVTFPDGHEILSPGRGLKEFNIPYFVKDVSFTLDQLVQLNALSTGEMLSNRLDLRHIGIFGVSYGGIVAAEACLKDTRLKACLVMEAFMTTDVVEHGLNQPTMWITRDATSMRLERQGLGGWTEKEIARHQTTMRGAYNKLHEAGYFLQIPGMFHIDLTDLNYLSPVLPYIGFSGPVGSQRAHDLINTFSLAFFDKHLRSQAVQLLNGTPSPYSDATIESRRP